MAGTSQKEEFQSPECCNIYLPILLLGGGASNLTLLENTDVAYILNTQGVEKGRETDEVRVMYINQWAWASSVDAIKPELEPIDTPGQASESMKDARISGHIITGVTIGGAIGFAALLSRA
ncbi:hypothetical protein BDA99DRAFT_538198 [Phascolomyces articulosus]|uniref:Uncharacterized protein n=1 Tax=Phascolomyces articulosus TaxID=60185 RepID=A0AAD5JYI6_9FUNG|nr:hypothetical protein BDA99DRAFT_538198 [Phascolomyces articulosus]